MNIIVCFPDTFESQRFLEFLNKYNLPCILVGKKKWLEVPNYSNIIAKIEIEDISVKNIDNIQLQISKVLEKTNTKILLNISFSELLVDLTSKLNENFDCWGIHPKNSKYFRDKYLMRKKTKEMNLPTPLFTLANNVSNRKLFYKDLTEVCKLKNKQFSFLTKPRTNWGCIGIKKFFNIEDAEVFFNKHPDMLDDIILEEFIEGCMHHVGSIAYNNKTYLNAVLKYRKPVFELEDKVSHIILYTANQHSSFSKKLIDYQNKLIKEFTHPIGMTDCEIIKENNTDDIYLCEIACRHSAVNVTRLYTLIMDIDPFEVLTKLIKMKMNNQTQNDLNPTIWNQSYSALINFCSPAAHLVNITDIDSFNSKEIVWKRKYFDKEAILTNDCFFMNSLGQLIIKTNDEKSCIDLMEKYDKMFSFETLKK